MTVLGLMSGFKRIKEKRRMNVTIKGLKITLLEFKERYEDLFDHYSCNHPAWGSLHIILADGNIRRSDLRFCLQWAKRKGDWEGFILVQLLFLLSHSQLKKLYEEGME